jgi:proteasome lid subunit RPN8/RPN11
MSTKILNPIHTSSMLYPSLSIDKTKPENKHFQCPRCQGNLRSRVQVKIVRKKEIVFGFNCADCSKRWYISSKLILNDVFEEQVQKIYRFTNITKKEFGALLVKTPEGIRMDMLDIGEDLSVSFKKTKEYRLDEKVIGTIHAHPITDIPSDFDIATFLRDKWEKISVVTGADSSINVMVRTVNTIGLSDINLSDWVEENKNLTLTEKAEKYQFLLFKGKVNNLKLLAGVSNCPITSLERLLSQIE